MTTDRTAAPARNTAPAPPAPGGARPANGKQQAAPDVFSTLLGAVASKADDAPRAQPRDRRPDNGLKPKDAPKPKDDAKPADESKPADDPKPADEATETEVAPKPARLVTPEIFALQLASPLPATPAEATPAAVQPAVPAETQQPATPALPAFAAQLQGPVAQQQTLPELPASPAEPLPATPAPTAANGGIPLPSLAGLTPATSADQKLAANLPTLKPEADVPAAPAPDANAAQVQSPLANQPQPQSDAGTQGQPQSQPQPQAQAQALAEAAKPVEEPAPATNVTPIVAPAPTAPVIPLNAPTGLQRLVPLYKAPEMTATMIHIAAERGVTHARLNLKPVELGGIEVRLRTTPEGVAAHLVADSPEAAKLLQQAAADLRRNLEARDVNLLSLDVSTQQEQQQQRNQQAAFTDEFGDARSFGLGGTRRNGSSTDESLTETPASAETTLVLPNGVLVDVLA